MVEVEPGSLLLLYTDGVVESPEVDLKTGIERLRCALSALDPAALDSDACRRLAAMSIDSDQHDDIALMAVAFR